MKPLKVYVERAKRASIKELYYRIKQYLLELSIMLGPGLRTKISPQKSNVKERVSRLEFPIIIMQMPANKIKAAINDHYWDKLNTDSGQIQTFEVSSQGKMYYKVRSKSYPVDIRAVFEPSRLQRQVMELLGHLYVSDSEELSNLRERAKTEILDWIKKNSFLEGPHYLSSLECALRIPVFFFCLKLLQDLREEEFQAVALSMYRHAWWVSKRLSLYSSLSNHTIGESYGLIIAGALFNGDKRARMWLEKGIELMEQEITHQILNDGGPAEQSLNYHRFVLDLYWLAVDFLEKNKLYDCSRWKERLIAGEKFYKAFELAGEIPSIGDSDDGRAVAPGLAPKRVIPDVTFEKFITFEESGYTIIRPVEDLFICFDHGPLGMPPLFGHGHADALSVVVSKGGLIFLCDPGTFRYNGVPEWRKYFKGTRAHNTVTIDGENQAVYETGFIWSKPYKCQVLEREEKEKGVFVFAVHDGYRRLKNPVIHKRKIFCANNGTILIEDTFEGKGEHSFELNYHLHPDVALKREGKWYILTRQSERLYIGLIDEGCNLVRGQENPILGWFSEAYGKKIETNVLQCVKLGSPENIKFRTVLSPAGPLMDDDVLLMLKEL